jgi:hypothetical protein
MGHNAVFGHALWAVTQDLVSAMTKTPQQEFSNSLQQFLYHMQEHNRNTAVDQDHNIIVPQHCNSNIPATTAPKFSQSEKKVFLPGAETHLKVSYSIYYTPPSAPSRPDMEFQMLPETESTPTLYSRQDMEFFCVTEG